MDIDWPTVWNELLRGLIAVLVGSITGFITYRLLRKADREKQIEKYSHELDKKKKEQIRNDLTKGMEDPTKLLNNLSYLTESIDHNAKRISLLIFPLILIVITIYLLIYFFSKGFFIN